LGKKSLLLFLSLIFLNLLFMPSEVLGNPGKKMSETCSTVVCCPGEVSPQVFKLAGPYMRGEEIKEIQSALQALGIYKGGTSGVFDQSLEKAVRAFQRKYGLKSDGVVGLNTRRALAEIFEKKPAYTAAVAVPKGTVRIVIDTDQKTLTVYDDNKVFKKYPVAVGKGETPTPIGQWRIKRKAKNWGTGFGTRWMELEVPWGIYGIHGTNKPWSIGREASHGCIRMFNRHVEELYQWVKVGTPVKIVGEVFPPLYEQRDKVHRGHRGTVVMLVQQGLIAEGYLKPPIDGIFGPATEKALKQLQKDRGFEVTGQVDVDIWPVLGL